MNRAVNIIKGEERLEITKDSVLKTIRLLDGHPSWNILSGSLGIAFVTPDQCTELHRRFFDDPDLTDVMTFPGDPGDHHAGDIAICPDQATFACLDSGLPFHEELTLYLVHGFLHLAGLDDRDEVQQRKMRTAEKQLMNHLHGQEGLLACRWMTNHV